MRNWKKWDYQQMGNTDMRSTIYSCVIVGSGFSGLALAIKLKEKGIQDFIILEKASSVGGTWRENTYPGAECDIPSALYSYSFEPYPHWEYKWSMQPQILEYINHVVDKYELMPHIIFEKEMLSAEWQEEKGHWIVSTKDNDKFQGKSFVSAVGQLHHPSTPDITNASAFLGDRWHSAKWDHSVSLKGKRVGVIGNAASAVQFIPEIAKETKQLYIFQRSANWMLPKQDRAYKEWEKKLVSRFPFLLKAYRMRIWLLGGAFFFLMKKGHAGIRKVYQKKSIQFIKKYIKDGQKINALIPLFPLGAKRVLFSDTYYPALARENVHLITHPIQSILPKGIQTSDQTIDDLDVLIYATGFKTNPFLWNLEIKGKGGKRIKEHWNDGPKNYLGIAVDQFPNLFLMYGPNTNLGHNSIILMSEAQATYIATCIHTMQSKKWKSLDIKKEAIDEYHQSTQDRLNNMIWETVENSWYKSDNGNIPNNYPGRTMEYIRVTKKVNFDHFDIVPA